MLKDAPTQTDQNQAKPTQNITVQTHTDPNRPKILPYKPTPTQTEPKYYRSDPNRPKPSQNITVQTHTDPNRAKILT